MPNGKISALTLRKSLDPSCLPYKQGLGAWCMDITRERWYAVRAFDPNVCDCVDWYNGCFSLARWHPVKACPPDVVRRWREDAAANGYTSTTGRCAGARHGFTVNFVGKDVAVDILRCHEPQNGLLVVRKTVDVAVDLAFAAAPGWGDLISWGSISMDQDAARRAFDTCVRVKNMKHTAPDKSCAAVKLVENGLHLRAVEKKLLLGDRRRMKASEEGAEF